MSEETKQLKSPEDPNKIGGKLVRDKKGRLVKGHPDLGAGRKEGTKNFSTLMDTAVKEIAKLNKITEGEVWQVLIKRGYSEAKDGNYLFYKDILDRYYGKAHDVFEGDPNKPLIVQISKEGAEKYDISPTSINNTERHP